MLTRLLTLVQVGDYWKYDLEAIIKWLLLMGNVVISKKFLRTRKIMVMHSNERGECVHIPS